MTFEPGRPTTPEPLHLRGPVDGTRLPSGVLDKLESIREHADSAHRAVPTTSERQEANSLRGDAQRRLDRLLAHPGDNAPGGAGFGLAETDVRVIQQRQVLADATTRAQRLDDRYHRALDLWRPRAATRTACETWALGLPTGVSVTDHVAVEEPRLGKSEDILGAIARLERRRREIQADQRRVEDAPFPLAYARQRLREIIDQLAQPPNVSMLIEHEAGEIAFPIRSLQSTVLNVEGRPIAFAETPDVLALMLWANKDLWLKQLDALLAEESDDGAALSVEARQVQLAQIQGDLLSVERDLSWWIWRGLSQGLPVWFTADMNPSAILGADLVTVPAALNSGQRDRADGRLPTTSARALGGRS
jgi:hypothetical protein